jgi:[glutamine synthetase] adenylyltransferase / [glutamine synthetase]-adenylyl-L-tyrosine phosphorylase
VRWHEAVARIEDSGLARFLESVAVAPSGLTLLSSVFGNSPFLSQCLLVEPAFVRAVLETGPEDAAAEAIAGLDGLAREPAEDAIDTTAIGQALRVARRRVALAVAIGDIAASWSVEQVTATLSAFADNAIRAATRHLLARAARAGVIELDDLTDAETGSGFIVLGMGKLGARELNYSSDIDLILLYDPDRVRTDLPHKLQRRFTRLARNLSGLLAERTVDGYVFRTDLRLRPDPGATPPAVSTYAAESYYESMGQNWERAAFIKARAIAGDLAAGAVFLDRLRPFIWRKHLDFAAIDDIHSIKRQIMAQRGHRAVQVAGHNIKLGRGGIREIEFFAQTQQLIRGGREPSLRQSGTCAALRALAHHGHTPEATATDLIDAYNFLRMVEHRLQMIDDQQTQTLPENDEDLAAVAAFCGFESIAAFSDTLRPHLHAVERHYAGLFEQAPALGGPGRLAFTGSEHDPETLDTIRELGFADPEPVSSLVRAWHHGRYRATRSQRARELLTELTPVLLEALAKTANPNVAFAKFDEFLARLPAGVQLFSLFHANPDLLRLVTEIMGDAPRLADHLSQNVAVLDAVLSGEFYDPLPEPAALAEDLGAVLDQARDFQDVLDLTRRWTNDLKFRVGVQMLRARVEAPAAGRALSDVAETVLSALLPKVAEEFAVGHGVLPEGGMTVVALGRLGSREMTMTSDLDLLFVYDASEGVDASNGPKPLTPAHYYARLSQRFLNAVTALTGEGRLYEVDMRLRPSGNKGPIASSLEAFARYHKESAWTWERMALTRARVICGPERLGRTTEAAIHSVLTEGRDPDVLLRDIATMRERIAREHPAASLWDAKYCPGGLVDIEFVCQYLQLRHASENDNVLRANTHDALTAVAEAGFLPPSTAKTLTGALVLWQKVQAMLRLTVAGAFDEEGAPEGQRRALARFAGMTSFEDLRDAVVDASDWARAVFEEILAGPAAALPPEKTDE